MKKNTRMLILLFFVWISASFIGYYWYSLIASFVAGAAFALFISSIFGAAILRSYTSRMDKLQRDYINELSENNL